LALIVVGSILVVLLGAGSYWALSRISLGSRMPMASPMGANAPKVLQRSRSMTIPPAGPGTQADMPQ
jgi:hypothetical protein